MEKKFYRYEYRIYFDCTVGDCTVKRQDGFGEFCFVCVECE